MVSGISARGLLLASLALAPLPAFAAGPAETSAVQSRIETIQVEAAVTAIDKAERRVTLALPNGKSRIVKAGADVRNFDQIAVGDRVQMRSHVAGILDLRRPTAESPYFAVEEVTGRAPVGEKPALYTEMKVSAIVNITAFDADAGEITFVGPLGNVYTLVSTDEAFRRTAKNFRAGELALASYIEALSIMVLPKK